MDDWFLQRGKAKLAIAEILGVLDRGIRRRLYESEQERLRADRDLYYRAKQLAKEEKPGLSLSLGTMRRIWFEHPMHKYLNEVYIRLDKEDLTPAPFDEFTAEESKDYLIWKVDGCKLPAWNTTIEEFIRQWRKERGRTLRVLPVSGSLPSNVHVRRPDHKEGSKRPPEVPKKADSKEELPPNGGTEGIGFRPIEDREIH